MGNLLCVHVHAGNIHNTKGGVYTFEKALYRYPTLIGVRADQGYRGTFRTRLHKHMRTSFRQILPQTALKILAGRKPACGFLPTLQQNYARKSAHISYEDRFLVTDDHPLLSDKYVTALCCLSPADKPSPRAHRCPNKYPYSPQ